MLIVIYNLRSCLITELFHTYQISIHTDWDVFKTAASLGDHIKIEEYADTVTSYIAKCTEDVIVTKTFTAQRKQKP